MACAYSKGFERMKQFLFSSNVWGQDEKWKSGSCCMCDAYETGPCVITNAKLKLEKGSLIFQTWVSKGSVRPTGVCKWHSCDASICSAVRHWSRHWINQHYPAYTCSLCHLCQEVRLHCFNHSRSLKNLELICFKE